MPREEAKIETRDGSCHAFVFTPEGRGPWPAVIVYMDAFGMRPAMLEMAGRLSAGGYLVLLPDLFHRLEDQEPKVPAEVAGNPALRDKLMTKIASLDREKRISDGGAYIEFLSSRRDVTGNRFGITGYCMGGNAALTVAGAYPGRFAAIASFHGGNLASERPESPHRFLKGISGRVYVAGADEDASFPEEQKEGLEKALTDAGIDHFIETYPGARHGFAVPDSPSFDQDASERHWKALFDLLGKAQWNR
ncbi:MAG TPA: dienelactone hydrolase family protein [Burkholderiales bacterium]|nr:dienelactone hydrolase family protein [Burkholderiales bacterium]